MMFFKYKITRAPDTSFDADVEPAYCRVEADLEIWVDGKLFLSTSHQLVLELAIRLRCWLVDVQQGRYSDLYYASDYFQEEPILHFENVNGSEAWLLKSVWSRLPNQQSVTIGALVKAVDNYLQELEAELKLNPYLDMNQVYISQIVEFFLFRFPERGDEIDIVTARLNQQIRPGKDASGNSDARGQFGEQ